MNNKETARGPEPSPLEALLQRYKNVRETQNNPIKAVDFLRSGIKELTLVPGDPREDLRAKAGILTEAVVRAHGRIDPKDPANEGVLHELEKRKVIFETAVAKYDAGLEGTRAVRSEQITTANLGGARSVQRRTDALTGRKKRF